MHRIRSVLVLIIIGIIPSNCVSRVALAVGFCLYVLDCSRVVRRGFGSHVDIE